MNDTTLRPEVAHFLSQVRARLADLGQEQREELLEGLEADLSEQVAAGDPLPEPGAYAAELRTAAGLGAPRRRLVRPDGPGLGARLDHLRAEWAAAVSGSGPVAQVWSVALTLRPAWWVLRAWIAVTLLDQLAGPWEYVSLWPRLGAPAVGPVLLLVAVVVSTLIGTGRLWPGSGPERPVAARVVLLVLNAVAVLAPLTFTGDGSQQDLFVADYAHDVPVRGDVLRHGRDVVRNIYAYDASGQPLTGVQLFDQAGRPVSVAARSSQGSGADRRVPCPWFNGSTALWNVFPLPERTQPRGTCEAERLPRGTGQAAQPTLPLASVPSVAPSPATTSAATPTP